MKSTVCGVGSGLNFSLLSVALGLRVQAQVGKIPSCKRATSYSWVDNANDW